MTVQAAILLPGCCAVLYAALGALIAWRSRRAVSRYLAACCGLTAAWGACMVVAGGDALAVPAMTAEIIRALAWFGFLLHLYRDAQVGAPGHAALFAAGGTVAGIAALGAVIVHVVALPGAVMGGTPLIVTVLARLGLAIVELLLIENLYLNLPEHARWHVALPAVLLGGLACFDIVLCTDTALFHAASDPLMTARTVGMILIAPLLLAAAARGNRWTGRIRLSRTAAFHSATLILSGGVLLVLAATSELFRRLDGTWGWVAQASLGFAALIGTGLVLTSGSARSRVQRLLVDHFFAERFDYRREWLTCIRTLSGDDDDLQGGLGTRTVRAIASVVDSPAGALFLRDGGAGPFAWAASWNTKAVDAVPPDHAVVAAMRGGSWIALLQPGDTIGYDSPLGSPELDAPGLEALGPLWLAVPLLRRGDLAGLVLLAPPRAPFPLEQEVFDLLRIVAQEVSTYLAEQRATQTLLQTRQLHDYSKRFAFVAHDIKNVSSQLALLHSNAQNHISNPEFQKDMLDTVDASVRKITALLRRLEQPAVDLAPAAAAPLPRLEALVTTYRSVRRAPLTLEHDGSTGTVAMGLDVLETAVTHLLNNAVEASAGSTVVLRVRHEARQVAVEIVDSGPGMTAEFVRDRLFRPFSTSKSGGSGIGAFQAREMVREAGGELVVQTEPGKGTTMRLLLPRTDVAGPPAQRTPVGLSRVGA